MLPVPKDICGQIEKLIDRFLWDGRKRRIKKELLYRPVTEGGIAIPNIYTFFEALKASWVPRLLTEGKQCWKLLPLYYINLIGKNTTILNFNFTEVAQFPEIKILPLFYQEAILAFNKAKPYKKPATKSDLLNSILWGNRYLMYETKYKKKSFKRSLYNKHWINSGVMRLGDVLTNNGEINIGKLTHIIKNKADFICVQSQIMCAVKKYKMLLSETDVKNDDVRDPNTEEPNPLIFGNKSSGIINVSHMKAKFFYNSIVGVKTGNFYAIDKWEKELNCTIDVSKVFYVRVKKLVDKKLSAFCFKVLHKVLICGEILHSWDKLPDPICPDCNNVHTVKHMLWECKHAAYTWTLLMKVKDIQLIWRDIVLGLNNKDNDVVVVLLAFCLYKWWIVKINKGSQQTYMKYLYHELQQKKQIYAVLNYHDTSSDIDQLLNVIDTMECKY